MELTTPLILAIASNMLGMLCINILVYKMILAHIPSDDLATQRVLSYVLIMKTIPESIFIIMLLIILPVATKVMEIMRIYRMYKNLTDVMCNNINQQQDVRNEQHKCDSPETHPDPPTKQT